MTVMASKLMLMAAIVASADEPPDIIKLGSTTSRDLLDWWRREAHKFARRLADIADQQHGDAGRTWIEEMGFAEMWEYKDGKLVLKDVWK